jgi:hypothetical protein
VSLTFVAGVAGDVFTGGVAEIIDAEMRRRFPAVAHGPGDAYESEPLDATGWRSLQERVLRTVEFAPQLTAVDAYQAVYVPSAPPTVDHVAIGSLADPLQIGSLDALLEELRGFAAAASLPTDDLELMTLAAHYLEADEDEDLDVQTYAQLMLTAKQAAVRNRPLWVVV